MIAINFGRVRFFCELSLMKKRGQKKIKAMIAIKFGRVLFFYDLSLMEKSGQKNLKILLAVSCSRAPEVWPGIGGASLLSRYLLFFP